MDLQLCFMNAIVFLEVTIVFSMVRLYFLCDAIYNCSLKSHNVIIHKWEYIWEKGPIGNWSHHVGFILELCS